MADWAFWLLIVSSAGLGVTAFGTIFLAWQVRLTSKAVRETGDTTKAMIRQNELTELAQRPHLSVAVSAEKFRSEIDRDSAGNIFMKYDAFFSELIISNMGKVPAYDLRIEILSYWDKHRGPITPRFIPGIAPNDELRHEEGCSAPSQVGNAPGGKFHIEGVIFYRSPGGTPYETHFKWVGRNQGLSIGYRIVPSSDPSDHKLT